LLKRIAVPRRREEVCREHLIIGEGDTADNPLHHPFRTSEGLRLNEEGREVIIALRGPGEYVGELALDGGRAKRFGHDHRADHRAPSLPAQTCASSSPSIRTSPCT
jgi:hypothetical protein